MNEIDQIGLAADLVEERCGLNHVNWKCEDDRAVDVLVIPVGYHESKDVAVIVMELTIFLCKDCAETLQNKGDYWICFYCTACGHSIWATRKQLRKRYSSDTLQLMRYCPECFVQEQVWPNAPSEDL